LMYPYPFFFDLVPLFVFFWRAVQSFEQPKSVFFLLFKCPIYMISVDLSPENFHEGRIVLQLCGLFFFFFFKINKWTVRVTCKTHSRKSLRPIADASSQL
jgi:hypothetical protein